MGVPPMHAQYIVYVSVKFIVGRVEGEWFIDIFFLCTFEEGCPV